MAASINIKLTLITSDLMKSFTFAAILAVAFADPSYDNGYHGPIAPENYGYAVNDFDINEPTIDAECYEHQVDIYSD